MTAKDITAELLDFELDLKVPAKPVRSETSGPDNPVDAINLVNEVLPRIQTELHAVLGQSQIISGLKLDDDKSLDMIRDCTERAVGLIQQSRLLLQIELGQYKIKNDRLSPAIMLDLLEAITRPLAEAKGLTYHFSKDADLPDSVYTCARALHYCLLQLIENAIQFTEKGKVELHVSVQENQATTYLSFTVTDSGRGIEENNQDKIFQAFYQASPEDRTGSGLGLTLTQQLAERLNGQLLLDSSPGKGTAITLKIPVGQDSSDPSPGEKRENSLNLIKEISKANTQYEGSQRG